MSEARTTRSRVRVGPDVSAALGGWRPAVREYGAVVCVSTADWDAELWTNKHHIMSRLATQVPVVYVESLGLREPRPTPQDFARVRRRLQARRRTSSPLPGQMPRPDLLTVLSPMVVPLHRSRAVRALNRRLLTRALAPHIAGLARPLLLWSYAPVVVDELALSQFDTIVYHCVDDYETMPGLPTRAIRDLEARFAPFVDAVFSTSPVLSERFDRLIGDRSHLLRNVADSAHFAHALAPGPIPADLAAIREPRALFVGALSDHKVDWELLGTVARRAPEWSFVFVGPVGQEQTMRGHAELQMLPNVHFLGARPYSELPNYMRGAAVGLVPYRQTAHTAAISPMKLWEYLAAGLPVVTTPLDALAGVEIPVLVAASPDAFVAGLSSARSAHSLEKRLETAAAHSWDANLDEMFRVLTGRS